MAPTAATPAWIHINDPAVSGQIPGPSREPAPAPGDRRRAGELRALTTARWATTGASPPTASPGPGRGSATYR